MSPDSCMSRWCLIALIAGCGAEPAVCPPPAPESGLDPLLITALCAMTLTPNGPGSNTGEAGVITNGAQRAPWFARTYDARFVNLDQLDEAFQLVKHTSHGESLMPSSFCGGGGDRVYVSIVLFNAEQAGKQGAWFVSGTLAEPTKKFVAGSTAERYHEATVGVRALLGDNTRIEYLRRGDLSMSGVSSAWEEAFRGP